MDKERAWNFIHKYIEGRFTAAEHQAFHEWLLNRPFAETEELLHEYSRVLEQKREHIPADPRLLERIERYISQQSDVQQTGPIGRRVKRKILYAAAAAVALFITLSGLYRIASNEVKETPVVHSAREVGENIAPGGDKALLTLADGSQILLDDAPRGALARQGRTQVLKLNHGELAYRPGNGTGGDGSSKTVYNTIETPRGGQYQTRCS
ncbi:MAG TPA: hypothetical protein VD772_03560, partial [Anseongella sp.]|nr:hypothetical protein [Anseongella sp.]